MLETLREYGRGRLDDERSVRLHSAHARQFANMALAVARDLDTSDERVAVALADGSFPDLRAAQRFSVEIGDVDTAFVLASSMREYAMRTLHYEVFTWADSMTGLPEMPEHPLYPVVLGVRAYGAFARGEFDNALELAAAGAAAERDLGVTPSGLIERVRSNVFLAIDEIPRALAENERMVAAAEANDDDSRRAHAFYFSSISMSSLGEYDEGRRFSELSRRAAQRTGGITDLAEAWVSEGFATAGDDDAALSALAHADRSGSIGGQPLDECVRADRGERPARLARGVGARLCRTRGTGRHLVPGRRVGAAVAHVDALRHRARPDRPAGGRGGGARSDRGTQCAGCATVSSGNSDTS